MSSASRLVNRNVVVGKHRTSIRLEPELWSALAQIAKENGVTIGQIVTKAEREYGGGRTSAVRTCIVVHLDAKVAELQQLLAEFGHRAAA
jgi:predicted DNA-binding ribbon-helix-helix protein